MFLANKMEEVLCLPIVELSNLEDNLVTKILSIFSVFSFYIYLFVILFLNYCEKVYFYFYIIFQECYHYYLFIFFFFSLTFYLK